MKLTSILLEVDGSERCQTRLNIALALAKKHHTQLTGVYASGEYYFTPVYAEAPIPIDIVESCEAQYQAAAIEAEAWFQERCKNTGISISWQSASGNVDDLLAKWAHTHDLVIIGQAEGGLLNPDIALQNRLLMKIVRPILLVPETAGTDIGRHVLIAWNASNTAARAVQDALPLLQAAETVQVLAIQPVDTSERILLADICAHLARHGIDASPQETDAEGADVSDVLLSCCTMRGVDLLITGGYGHTRLREVIFGGVTRSLLNATTVPVLMSH